MLCPITLTPSLAYSELRIRVLAVTTDIMLTVNFFRCALIIIALACRMLLISKRECIVIGVSLTDSLLDSHSWLSTVLGVRHLVCQLFFICSSYHVHFSFQKGLPISSSLNLIDRVLQYRRVIEDLSST